MRAYLRELAEALWEGATSRDPRVTGLALELLRLTARDPEVMR